MRFLTLSCEYPPVGGGGATACRWLATALTGLGHSVDVLTAGMSDLSPTEKDGAVSVFRVRGYRRHRHYSTALEQASFVPGMLRAGRELVRSRGYDVIHAHFVLPTGWVAARLARASRLPYVVTAHGSDVPGYNPDRFAHLHRVLRPVFRRVLDQAALVTVPSRFLARLIGENSPVRCEVVPNSFLADAPPALPRQRRILSVARLVARKGVDDLIAVAGTLPPGWEIVVAGDGPMRPELERQAAGLPVRFMGFVDREQLRTLYASSAIFAFPSLVENFPMVLLEAMSAGCAIVTTDAHGCAEVVGDAALRVPGGDREALAGALARLTSDDELRRRLSEAARTRSRLFEPGAVASTFAAACAAAIGTAGNRDPAPLAPQSGAGARAGGCGQERSGA